MSPTTQHPHLADDGRVVCTDTVFGQTMAELAIRSLDLNGSREI